MNRQNLTPDQLKESKLLDKELRKLIKLKEELQSFKLDDVYILEYFDPNEPNKVWVDKSYFGFPVKYKVVHISPEGIPYLRRLTPNGKPTGAVELPDQAQLLSSLVKAGQINSLRGYINDGQRFIPDPEQLDSILLQQEFDPTAAHKAKLDLFNEIKNHNKKVTVKTGYFDDHHISAFFKGLKSGDKFWMGPDKVFVVQSIVKTRRDWKITAIDQMQQERKFNFSSFNYKRLYREAPRSFKRESVV